MIAKCGQRVLAQPALADDDPDATMLEQRTREAFHPIGRRRADAHRRVAGRMLDIGGDLAHVRRRVDDGVAAQVEAGGPPAIEHRDLRGIADAEQRRLQRHRVVDAQRTDLRFGHRRRELVMGHAQNPYATPAVVTVALARRAEWHCMLTATGFIVMCVAASSTCTANAVESPPSPCGPTPSRFTAAVSSVSSFAPSTSSQWLPSGRVAARFARATHRSDVPPTPTPTIVGGQVFPPAAITQSTTNVLIASIPSAGTAILRNELFSEPLPLGIIRMRSVPGGASKPTWITGISMPHDVCSLRRVSGCTTDERSGCSRVARSQPRRIAACSFAPSTSTPRPIPTS